MSRLATMLGASRAGCIGAPARAWLITTGALASRIIGATLGGYGLAALSSMAALALPMALPQAVLTGMLASFAVYTAAVIWCFAAHSASRAWGGLVLVALPLALASWGRLGP